MTLGGRLSLSGPWFLFSTVRELAQVVYKVLPALLSSGFTLWFLSLFLDFLLLLISSLNPSLLPKRFFP